MMPLRRENGRRNTSKDVLFLSLFLLAFEKKVIVSDFLVKTLAIVQNIQNDTLYNENNYQKLMKKY